MEKININWKSFIKGIEKGPISTYKIYAIIILEDVNEYKRGDVCYIGITTKSLGSRRSGHVHTRVHPTTNIGIVLIENTGNRYREGYYISLFKKMGCKLTNTLKGYTEKIPSVKEPKKIKPTDSYYQMNKQKLLDDMKKYQEEHKEELKEYRKKYYQEYWKDKEREQKELNKEQKEKAKLRSKEYYQKNKEKLKEQYLEKKLSNGK